MEIRVFQNKLAELKAENALLKFFILLIAASNVVFGYLAYRAVALKTIELVPIGYDKKIVITGNRVNEAYTLAFARFFFDSLLNYTPTTVKKQYEVALSCFAPSTYPKYKKIFMTFVEQAQMAKLASVFLPEKIEHDPRHRVVKAYGKKINLLGDEVVDVKMVSYAFTYQVKYGSLRVLEYGKAREVLKLFETPSGGQKK